MKIQCACGTKYAFDISPEMAVNPIRFVCQSCGLDSSELVNQLIRQELGVTAPPLALVAPLPPTASAPAAAQSPAAPTAVARPASPPPPAPPAGSAPGLRVAVHAAASGSAAGAAEAAAPFRPCGKHPGQDATHSCLVCHKPMCPLCMRVTGLVCSPFCRTKAEAQGIDVPEYSQQRDVADRRRWRKVAGVVGAIAAVILAGLGFWFWYAWFGSVPKVVYAHRFEHPGYSGSMHLAPKQQLVVLHGGSLARHDLESSRIVWSVELIDRDRIAKDSERELAEMKKARDKAMQEGADPDSLRLPTLDRLTKDNIRAAADGFALQVSGESVWLVTPEKLTRYAWADGKVDKEITVTDSSGDPVRIGPELLFVGAAGDASMRVDLASGESTRPASAAPAVASKRPGAKGPPGPSVAGAGTGGGQTRPGSLNPSAIANRAQNMPLPNRLALPATIAAAENQRRAQAVMNDEDESVVPQPAPRKAGARVHPEVTQRLRTASGTVEFATRLLEEKIVVREAMKAAPKKSALEGTVNAAATTAIANELLNEMQRDRAGSTVEEDESRYQVTVRRSSQSMPPWSGEVIGPPAMHLLKTVDVVTAGKGLLVLNKNNQKLWDGKLNFPVTGRGAIEDLADLAPATDGLSSGAGPCIERAGTLYVSDQGMLTSFALADGNVRWRLPSVGIAGIWFDDQGMMYLNTTTAGPDSIKYSKQIDISKKTQNQVLKVDPHTGQTLWSAQNEGLVTYIWDKYIYTAESNPGDDGEDEAGVMGMKIGLEIPAHIRLRRLDADNGRVRWEHYQQRYPLDVHFDRNTIQFLFKKEVQYLRFVVL